MNPKKKKLWWLSDGCRVVAELHNQLLAVEAEMSNKNKEIQTLHSSLTEAVVSKDRLEQKVRELMEMSKHSMQDDSLQARVQVCSQLAVPNLQQEK